MSNYIRIPENVPQAVSEELIQMVKSGSAEAHGVAEIVADAFEGNIIDDELEYAMGVALEIESVAVALTDRIHEKQKIEEAKRKAKEVHDAFLEPNQLRKRYGGHWSKRGIPGHPLEEWRHEVLSNETRMGYWEWAHARMQE